MKKVKKLQSKFIKEITFISLCCYEYGYGSTYRKELRVIFYLKKGILKSVKYNYTLKNLHLALDTIFISVRFDKRVKQNLINGNTKRF